MKKYQQDFVLVENVAISSTKESKKLASSPLYSVLKLRPLEGNLPEMRAGQFVQVAVPSKTTFLRRPISICLVQNDLNLLWLLVRRAGDGTASLIESPEGSILNLVLPLGNGFTQPTSGSTLLIGGGVGVAPLLELGKEMSEKGLKPTFLLGARAESDLLLLDEFRHYGEVFTATEDGSAGEKGFVTQHSILNKPFNHIACCGPLPMMKAVAGIARQRHINCELSLENMMACGLGACLCCVEDTADEGNVCVCKEGPVFHLNRLKW